VHQQHIQSLHCLSVLQQQHPRWWSERCSPASTRCSRARRKQPRSCACTPAAAFLTTVGHPLQESTWSSYHSGCSNTLKKTFSEHCASQPTAPRRATHTVYPRGPEGTAPHAVSRLPTLSRGWWCLAEPCGFVARVQCVSLTGPLVWQS
jgi:hypothetical protein